MNKLNLPGPKAREVLKDDERYISPSYTRPYPAVIQKGKGMHVWDVDGNEFLDFAAGIAVCATGHCHSDVVRAIEEQAEDLIHMSGTDFYYPIQVRLAEKLAEITPGAKNKRVFFCNSGAEAVEAALKLVRWKTKRMTVLAFINSFHGRTYGAMSLTASKAVQRNGFGPLLSGIIHIFYPYCYRCPINLSCPSCNFACIDCIEDVVFHKMVPPEEVAALFAEPIQGEGGYIIPPDGYFQKLKELLNKYDILLVDDEVQSGMGRTGRMFAIEHWETIPDIVCVAKGIASGMPLGATVARRGLMDWGPGTHASTFGGNPVSCAAALATISLLENGLVENAKEMGEYFMPKLKELMTKYQFIGDVRGKGLMIGIEIVKDKKTKEKDKKRRDRIIMECFRHGLLILGCGDNVVRFMPPLIVEKKHIDKAVEIFEDVLKEVEAS
ncbi:MAG TPA: acetyl ornithine aminotransferase family protein [bacterium (Candidatus Stahlbacteria)]|nr:acetyl ornithine aminotransferase family protein [Candidatus Stahlbacteria bacterium]